jgi:phosphoribosyl 1,2-cyclic phosphodiesterase
VPVSGAAHVQTGGNTPCVEVAADDSHPLILDAGTGLRGMGLDLMDRNTREGAGVSVLLSHVHWDHIQGIPFFEPLYQADWAITFYSLLPADELRQIIHSQLSRPYFYETASTRATYSCRQIQPEGLRIGGLTVRPFALNHPGGSSGFRIEGNGAVIVYASDNEHGDEQADQRIRRDAREADLLIWDSQYTPADYGAHQGWGHSTWLEGTRVAADADAKRLVLFHHDPSRSDEEIRLLEEEARLQFANTTAAREGLTITL